MKFRRSGGKNPETGEPRGSMAPTPAPARRRRVAFRRVLALLVVGLVVYTFLFIEQSWIRADGLVQGPTVLVEPVNKARIKEIRAACNDVVKEGQELVLLENETKGIEYDNVVRQLESRKIELSGNVKVAAEDVSQARVGYNGRLAVLAEKATIFNIHDRLYKEGVIARTEWDLARIAYKTSEAESLSAEADWRSKQAVYDRAERQLLSDAKAIDKQLSDMRKSEEIQKIQVLRAPKAGVITECGYLAGAVVDAGISVFVIFDPKEAYVEAYFEPTTVQRLAVGMKGSVRLPGFAEALELSITSIDTVITRRPEELTRYFWQREQWTQYQPVRFSLKSLTPEQLARVRYGAHAAVSFLFLPSWAESIYASIYGRPPRS